MNDESCAGVILCGGPSKRLGNIDKPLVHWRGRPLIEPIVDVLTPKVSALFISANRNLQEYQRYGTVIVDQLVAHQGPLAGIQAVLKVCEVPLLFICPGDVPQLPSDLLDLMREKLRPEDQAVVVHDGTQQQNLHLLIRTSCLQSLNEYLNGGSRSVHGWLSTLLIRRLNYPHTECFRNFNSPDDFQ